LTQVNAPGKPSFDHGTVPKEIFSEDTVGTAPMPTPTSTPSIFSSIQKFRSLLTRDQKLQWVAIVAFAFLTSILEVITASIIVIFARVLNEPQAGQTYLSIIGIKGPLSPGRIVFYIALTCGGIYLIKNLIAAAEVFYQNFSIQKMNYYFKNKLLRLYAQANYEFYLTRNSSQGYSVISSDTEKLFSSGMVSLAGILSEGMVFLCLIGIVIFMNPSLAFMVFAIGSVLGLIISKGVLPRFYGWGQKLQEADLQTSRNLLQFFHAFKEIILLGKQDSFIQSYDLHSQKKSQIQALQATTNSLPRMVIEVLFVGLFVATVSYLCLQQETPIQMIGILGGYLYVGFRLMPGLNRVINHLNAFKVVIPCIERVYTEFHSIGTSSYVESPHLQFTHSLTLTHLSFHYPQTEKKALDDLTLEIKKGECLGIVGETGSGKSTLVDMILGLLKPQEGTILIDDRYGVSSPQWHGKIGYVPQSIYLTDDSIKANIAFGENPEDIDLVRLHQAIEDAQLKVFIDRLPHKEDTIVGERGIRLSGGERQRISIARALYRQPQVLIFDEATSALDNETEARLMETIHAVSQNRTVIMVAHRLTTLKDCHRIVKMEKGKIRQIVSYKELSQLS
jgi:ATP-binding cassette subfamily C protein